MRNRVLKDYKRGLTPRGQAIDLLESIDPLFLPLAAEITVARLEALRALHDDFSRAVQFVLERNDVDISVEYVISKQNALLWKRSDLLSAMHKRGLELREQELESGLSLVGPQRHDIRLLFTGKDSRFFCSQGQQRALILSFKMAQILYHYKTYQVYPFLLLDDVLSELDPIRRANLVKFLRDIPAQIFLTTTDLSFSMDFGDRGINVFHIDDGVVSSVKEN
jgi:DNA replication and repair protein RecF